MEPIPKPVDPFRMTVLALGNMGLNCLAAMPVSDREELDLVAVHTDLQALTRVGLPRVVPIGEALTGGQGTGGDVDLGRRVAELEEPKLRALVSHTQLVCLVTALGGGTGSGVAPELMRYAQAEGARSLCVVSLPFRFEAVERRQQARQALRKISEWADAVVVLPNDRLLEPVDEGGEEPPMQEALAAVNAQTGTCLTALWRLLSRPSLLNVDLADFRQLLRGSGGTGVLATAEAGGEQRVDQVLECLLRHPMLDRGNVLAQAQGLLVAVHGGPDLRLSEVEFLIKELRAVTPREVRLFFGTDIDPDFTERLAVTILAAEEWREGIGRPIDLPGLEDEETGLGMEPALLSGEASAGSASERASQLQQGNLNLDTPGKGRFKDVEPTFYEGQDLDVPPFMRRGIRLTTQHG